VIVLFGVAGAGKSMQGRLFADERGYAWISTGELLRVLVTGKRRQEMLEGKLLSDDEMIRIMDTVFNLINLNEEFVLDGFPRTIAQSDWLLEQVHNNRIELTAIFNLQASEDVVRGRLEERGRIDDTSEAISNRFEEYKTVTLPIIDFFKKEDVPVFDIDAAGTPEAVHDEMIAVIDKRAVPNADQS
jgi:adenylate kinase